MMKTALTEEQQKIVESTEQKIVVMASAASGKTFCLIERVRQILRWGGDPSKMVCITFTNNAADEIRARLGEDYKDEMFVGTIHSYANQLLLKGGIDTANIRDEENFDELFELVMENPDVVKPIGFLALDEAQDSNSAQFEFIFNMLNPKNFIVFGDIRQTIYGFAGSNPKLLLSLMRDSSVTVYDLIENHRNGQKIIDYSNWILDKMKSVPYTPVVGMRKVRGTVATIGERGIVGMIERDGNYGDWVILCRTNARIYYFLDKLKRKEIPCITFRQAQGSNAELQEKMRQNSVKVLTIHSSKGLEWNKVIVADQCWSSEEDKRLMYVAATRARDELYWVKGF